MNEEIRQIEDYRSRPAKYANVDGLNEMSWGLIVLGFAFLDWVQSLFAGGPARLSWLWLAFSCGWCLLVYFGGKVLKRYVTYPRTGFVAWRRTTRTRLVPFVSAMVAALTVFLILAIQRRVSLRLVTLIGPAMVLFYLFLARPDTIWKWAVALVMAVGAIGLLVVPLAADQLDQLALLFYGLVFLAAGVIRLGLYLRHTQPPSQVAG